MPDYIFNCLTNYIEGKQNEAKFDGKISFVANIKASVVQGPVVEPAKFVISTSDLHPVSDQGRLLKYADDSYLLLGSSNVGIG